VLKNLTKATSLFVCGLLLSFNLNANDWTTGTSSILDLREYTGTTQHNISDDGRSNLVDIGFDFDFYNETYTGGYISTNGCFSFTTSYCNDYTPDPLPDTPYTIYPFWTDLIRDSGSKILSKSFEISGDNNDYFVVGWYNLREYNRASDNTIEMLLYEADSAIEFRYGPLDIKNHDVLIGIQGSSTEYKQYLFHDECNTGSTNLSTCVNTNWNSTTYNTLLENKSLNYNNACSSDPLSSSECLGYATAYLTQQCGLNSLYDTACPLYWDAYDDLQCTLDPQYGPFCAGYTQEESVAYYVEDEFDYGYTEEDYWYDEEYDEWLEPNDPCYENACADFTDEDWYELDVEQFGQEQVDEWFGTDVEFSDDGMVEWETTTIESYDDIDVLMNEYDLEQEQLRVEEELYYEEEYLFEDEYEEFDPYHEEVYEETYEEAYTETYEETYEEVYEEAYEEVYEETYEDLYAFDFEQEYETIDVSEELLVHFEHEQIIEVFEEEPREFLEFETVEELEEWFEEEMEAIEEEEIELVEEDIEEEVEDIEEETEETRVAEEEKSGISRETQLNVVASTIQAATNSVSGTTAGTSIQATGNTKASGGVANTTSTAVANSASGGGISTSNSPSISAQVASSAIQTQQVLSMSTTTETISFSSNVETTSSALDTSSTLDTSTTVDSNSTTVGADNTAVGNTASADNTAVGNTNSNSNVAVGSDTTSTTETTDNSSVASNTSGDNNTAVGNTSGDNNVAVGNTSGDNNVAVGSVQAEINVAIAEVSTTSEADTVADKIVAQNIKQQQEQLEEKQQETGEYGDSSTLIAFMGFVPGFSDYRQIEMPTATVWYEPEDIYANASIPDNTKAFFGMYSDSLNGLNAMKNLQPNL